MTTNFSSTTDSGGLIGGVDTHADTHTLAILSANGGVLCTETFPATTAGYAQMITTLNDAGQIATIGVEGTNSYGAGLTRALISAGFTVREVLRPTRRVRRMDGKSDPVDAIAAARTILSGVG
ncbi:MAG TPA: transposase, partial [Beutenbergiaceae bacterium]|nr:transposase [Beutenbergiaceae bacterium]